MDDAKTRDPLTVAVVVPLACAAAWAVLLVAASFLLPLVTESGVHPGRQPRVPLVQHFGLVGVLPAVGFLLAVGVGGLLLLQGRGHHLPTWRLVSATAWAGLVLLAELGSVVFTHLAGLLTIPCGVLLVAAVTVAAVRRALNVAPVRV
ncbi:hypothetical protein SAMN06264364_14118 [Quadrisphaera granulorum]|uniref:Uncharacterized protein n=1 Tax=Quadrisphaera granulorum TaxID=317664 RepID=A0A315ZNG9_9ACTN|nr:hypothetical protein [Quadrisphaera granulorum]PWJ47121.1 hypothetical protein BXY45_14118 [Quadrisphaera granulorum]SZE98925.1 hypothetical protein SAMN06264364_14118 [Quadrisphaera granulorum]